MSDKTDSSLSLEEILKLCSLNQAFREEFKANPREVLDKYGIILAPGLHLQVVELPVNTMAIGIYPLIDLDENS